MLDSWGGGLGLIESAVRESVEGSGLPVIRSILLTQRGGAYLLRSSHILLPKIKDQFINCWVRFARPEL